MRAFLNRFPDQDILLALEPEELAGYLIEHLNSLMEGEKRHLNRYNFTLANGLTGYPSKDPEEVVRAVTEAWMWLEREGFLAPRPGSAGSDSVFITRRGKKLTSRIDFEKFRKANILPKEILHPVIALKVWATFIRGEYDTAVFQAFKEVEVMVREKANLATEDIGVKLMRKAFDETNGPLRDKSRPESERQAMAHLFAGAMGYFKNPASHRTVPIQGADEAVEMIVLASHLLRIVETTYLFS